jgi:16S rRNA processing protein RimM
LKNPDLVVLGKVIRSQGSDGRLKLRLSEKGPTGFVGTKVYLERGERPEAFKVEALTLDRNATILKLKGVDSLAAADALAGCDVYAAESDFRGLGDDRFYDFQLLGSRVLTLEGTEVGTIEAILAAGGPVLLVVGRAGREVYIPFTEAICVKVDAKAGEVVIDPPDGLLDLNEI